MIAVVVRAFNDKEAGKLRSVGERFECSRERFDAINAAGFGALVKEGEKPKRKARKKGEE